MKFKSLHSKTAMFTYRDHRYRCQDGIFNTADKPDEKGLVEFLKQNPNFAPVEGEKEPAGSTGADDLEGLSLDELKGIAVKEKVASPSELDRVKSEETMIKKIREAREAAE